MLARREDLDEYCFDKAAQIDSDWLVPLEIGCIYEFYGRTTKALARTRAAVEQAPDHAYGWYRQGMCELALGMIVPAEKSFARCLQLAPKHEEARARLHELARRNKTVGGAFRRLFGRS
jgi:tetratricopeptide (TPR) repeat protein